MAGCPRGLTMAVISLKDWRYSTMRDLCAGSTRAKHRASRHAWRCASGDSSSNSLPVYALPETSSVSEKMPIRRQMATAVPLLSPVIMITRMPALRHISMEEVTSLRGGSSIPTQPTKVRLFWAGGTHPRPTLNSWDASTSPPCCETTLGTGISLGKKLSRGFLPTAPWTHSTAPIQRNAPVPSAPPHTFSLCFPPAHPSQWSPSPSQQPLHQKTCSVRWGLLSFRPAPEVCRGDKPLHCPQRNQRENTAGTAGAAYGET